MKDKSVEIDSEDEIPEEIQLVVPDTKLDRSQYGKWVVNFGEEKSFICIFNVSITKYF